MVELEIENGLDKEAIYTPKKLKLTLRKDSEGNISLQTKDNYDVIKISTDGTVTLWTEKLGQEKVYCSYKGNVSNYFNSVYSIKVD